MSKYTLTYFDIEGGRAEPIRIALHAAGVDFEDRRISFAEFGEVRAGMRFNAVPVLEIDGAQVSQSNALSRYAGRMAGLYPVDDLQALYCDEVMGAVEDLTHHIVRTFGLEGEELRLARGKLVEGWMATILRGLEQLLARGGGEYFADGRLTVADLKVFVQSRSLAGGHLDHVPTDIVERLAPGLARHRERIAAEPQVLAYYASRTRQVAP